MTTQIIFITIIAVLLAILVSRKGRPDLRVKLRRGKEKILRPAKDKIVGICSFALGQEAKKQERKEKILAILTEQESVSNADIVERLGVSPRTVVNYMDELEREGRAEQIGDTGRGVHYRLKPTKNP